VEQYCQGSYKGIVPPDYQALYQMADGLHFIHSKNLAHRDISTSNVLIKLTGDKVVLKIADFGVCKIASKSGSLSMSGDGFKGTIPFIAPELLKQMLDDNHQESNENGVRGHTSNDIFSLGCVLYRFLTKDGHPFIKGAVKLCYLTINNRIKSNILDNKQSLERK
jgi:serine/threonine-protein kinase/endoribonuclease IRE1